MRKCTSIWFGVKYRWDTVYGVHGTVGSFPIYVPLNSLNDSFESLIRYLTNDLSGPEKIYFHGKVIFLMETKLVLLASTNWRGMQSERTLIPNIK